MIRRGRASGGRRVIVAQASDKSGQLPPPLSPPSAPSTLRPETRSATSIAASPFLTAPHAAVTLSLGFPATQCYYRCVLVFALSSHSFTLTQVSLELRP